MGQMREVKKAAMEEAVTTAVWMQEMTRTLLALQLFISWCCYVFDDIILQKEAQHSLLLFT